MDESFNISEALVARHAGGGRAAQIALIDGDRQWTYAELHQAVTAVGTNLLAYGIAPGEHVAILMEDGLETVAAFLGVARAGGVAVLLNPLLPAEHYEQLFARCRPKLVLASPDVDRKLSGTHRPAGARWSVVRPDGELFTAAGGSEHWPATRRTSPAFALFTSGTTGSPSGVVHRHQDIEVTNRDYGAQVLGMRASDITFSPSPLFFAYGLNSVHLALYHGATAVLPPKSKRPEVIARHIERFRPTIFFTVPTVYRMLLGLPEPTDLGSLRLCISAGEGLPAKIFHEWKSRHGHEIIDGIGTTEVLSTFISNTPDDIRPGSTGKPVQGFEVRLVADNGEEAESGEPGILWVRGGTIPDFYMADPTASRSRFQGGWFVTNDVFRRDPDGYYHYHGRADDRVKVGGQWIAPTDIESVLLEHPDIVECAVVSRSDEWGLTRPHAFVVLRPQADAGADWRAELKQHCRQRLSSAAYPHFVSVQDSLPRTFTGKVQRFVLRNQAELETTKLSRPRTLDRHTFDQLLAEGRNQVPLVEILELGDLGALDLLRALPERSRFLLDSTRVSQEGRYSILGAEPFLHFRAKGQRYWIDDRAFEGNPIEALQRLLDQWRGIRLPGMPMFCGGAVGYFAYEANRYFENLPEHPNDDLGMPDIAFHFVDTFLVIDHIEGIILAVATGSSHDDCQRRVSELVEVVERARAMPRPAPSSAGNTPGDEELAAFTSNFARDDYLDAVRRIQEYIRDGDTYQVNLSQRLDVAYDDSGLALYETLSAVNPVHFASYFAFDDFEIVSASPERLVRVESGRAVARPIAGTRRKGTAEENVRFAAELRTCDKEQAEHAMLVDLERNDLGRVCKYGSVHVSKLMEIIEYAHVIHIESEVEGEVADSATLLDVVGAMFPGGTITGVPKIRTMEIITELEPNVRGIYTGSIGYFSFAGDMDLNIVIRTILLKDGHAYVQVGGGVVIDSDPQREYKETLNKARSQLLALARRGTN